MGCTRQYMHHIALQQSEVLRSKFMAEISVYDPSMLIWIDESGCDRRNTIRKYGYSLKGHPLNDYRLLVRGIRYSVIPIISMNGILDLYITSGTINGEKFIDFIQYYLMPLLKPFNYSNEHSVVILDNASIHHVEEVVNLIETQAGAKVCFLPPYSPDLMPAEGVFSEVKSIMKQNHELFEISTDLRALISLCFGMITEQNCKEHIKHCGYTHD